MNDRSTLAAQHLRELEKLAEEAAELSLAAVKAGDLKVAGALARERRELAMVLDEARRAVARLEGR